ncbi:hypothetical protein [Peribacillus frigoritolerans]|uniref:hypothetical protein n=1 Tax=Peribacillus castrilensis TaxID=2897690 RepID=UPI002DD2B813|nr:hypothetical protein [Peribacillus castrilensis]
MGEIIKRFRFTFIILLLFVLLTSCGKENNFNPIIYSGNDLKIGIVGEKPKSKKKMYSFIPLTMEDISSSNFDNLDSVFINKKYLSEAAKEEYANVYLESPLPFVFIDSYKVYLAYIDKDTSYENAHKSKSGDYLIGFYKDTYFGLSLYNNIKNEETIQDSYARMFNILEKFKSTGEIVLE